MSFLGVLSFIRPKMSGKADVNFTTMANKVSKSFKAVKGSTLGEDQFIELLQKFQIKTGCVEEINGSGKFKVLQSFKIIVEVDVKEIRGQIPQQLEYYLGFKDNHGLRTMNTPVEPEAEAIPIPEEDDDEPYYIGQLLIDPKKEKEEESQEVVLVTKKKTSRKKK